MHTLKMITPFWFTRSLLIILLSLPSFIYSQSESGLYDMNGNRLYYLVDNGKKHTVDANGKKIRPNPEPRYNSYYHEKNLISSTGETYYFDYGWDQIIHNGKVLIEYNFNRRRYEWVEHQNVDPKRITKSKNAERIYTNYKGFKTPEQGDIALLTFSKGTYYDEFGAPLYTLKGRFPGWSSIVMFHNYYQENYTGTRLDSVLALRKPYRDSINNAFKTKKNLVMDMINLGNKYKKTEALFSTYKIVYFTMIDKNPELLSEEQIKNIPNDLLIINKKTRRSTNPFDMPAAGHYTKKKDAKKLGVSLPKGPLIIWEIKIKPEFKDKFSSLI